MAIKIFVISPPCSGKSYFVRECHGIYRGMRIVDFDKIPFRLWEKIYFKFKRLDSMPRDTRFKLHSSRVMNYLNNSNDPVCVLDGIGPPNPNSYKKVIFVGVLPLLSDAMLFCNIRNDDSYYIGRWREWDAIEEMRSKVSSYCYKNNLPIYTSFSLAISSVLISNHL